MDPDVPDRQPFSAFGDAPTEALAEIEQVIEAWLAVARRRPADPEAPMPCTASRHPLTSLSESEARGQRGAYRGTGRHRLGAKRDTASLPFPVKFACIVLGLRIVEPSSDSGPGIRTASTPGLAVLAALRGEVH